MHERTWRAMLAEAGLNPYLLEVTNLREHCSWIHPDEELTTQKAIDLVTAAVERVALHEPLFPQRVPVTKVCHGCGWRNCGHSGLFRSGKCGYSCLSGGKRTFHWRAYGAVG